MNEITCTVYWTHQEKAHSAVVTDLTVALKLCESLRKDPAGFTAITMVTENTNRVGKDGVDEVKDGKTPDGVEYTWNKSSRIGATRR